MDEKERKRKQLKDKVAKDEKQKKMAARVMPHNNEAEQSGLGACLMDCDVAVSNMNTIKQDDFYSEAHQDIFSAMYIIFKKNQPIDIITLHDELEAEGILNMVGGIDYITNLINILPSAANYNVYLEIVKRDSVLRNIIKACNSVLENTYDAESKQQAIDFARCGSLHLQEPC